jgi:hypothetical protein
MHHPAAGPPGRCPVQPSTPLGPDQVNVIIIIILQDGVGEMEVVMSYHMSGMVGIGLLAEVARDRKVVWPGGRSRDLYWNLVWLVLGCTCCASGGTPRNAELGSFGRLPYGMVSVMWQAPQVVVGYSLTIARESAFITQLGTWPSI